MQNRNNQADPALQRAVEGIQAGSYSCALVRGGEIIHTDEGPGVAPLMRLHRGDVSLMAGSAVADKIIGKAAAMLVALGGGSYVYGETMSEAATAYLAAKGIPYGYGRLVERITNRAGDGTCPIELSVLDITDENEAFAAISATIEKLMRG